MADVVSHLASVLIPGVALRADRAALLALGVALPDIGGRVPGLMTEVVERFGGRVSAVWHTPFAVLHQPVGALLFALLLAWVVPAKERPAAALAMAVGVLAHLGLDSLQDHHGFGYHLLVPFDYGRYEFACIGSEATVPWAPWLALLTAALWVGRALLRARRRR